jgi:hypothetical protein
MDKLLETRQITLQELTSQYTGGPVKATIWTQRQPYRNGDEALVVASIYNDGNGVIENINNFEIRVPEILEFTQDDIIGDTFGDCTKTGEVIRCSYGGEIEPGEYKRVSFLVTPNIGNEVDRKTTLIVGLASYTYKKTSEQTLQLAPFPQTQ